MDDRGLPIGSRKVFELMKNRDEGFSVEFYKRDGHYVELNDCIRIPNAKHLDKHKYVTVVPRDNRVHPYPIYIRILMKFNGQNVFQG
jgi:predicted DNA-binding protein (MmcQ/YjbR family)